VKTQKRVSEFFETYTRDLKADDLQRLFTRDTREAYDFFTRNTDLEATKGLPWHKRIAHQIKLIYMAFAMRMSPARRVVHGVAVLAALFGLLRLSRYGFPDGTGWLLIAFVLVNLLVVLEVADRLSLKNDLEVAREIQLAMLPRGVGRTAAVETAGVSRPANTVGGDFYDVIPLGDGRLVVALGDVAGKGSPAALLMALLMAMLRTLVHAWEGESRDTADLMARLNVQVARHAPGSRFITLFCAVYDPATHELEYVNAGHMPPILMHVDGTTERLTRGGIALGMFDASTYQSGRVAIAAGDLLTMYSDGITEAEDPQGRPLDDQGLETILQVEHERDLADITAAVLHAVEVHTADTRFADDLTILLMRRTVAA
jgi:serine phosphatase RsbU (regulator of sigma subunit)